MPSLCEGLGLRPPLVITNDTGESHPSGLSLRAPTLRGAGLSGTVPAVWGVLFPPEV